MTAVNCYLDPYLERATAKKKRVEFEKLKRTQEFKDWYSNQKYAQRNKCAYCRVRIDNENIVVHVDHVTPLRFSGKNEYDNFVLSCRRCNTRKWVANNVVVPDWIVRNKARLADKRERNLLKEKQYALARQVNEDILLDELRSRGII